MTRELLIVFFSALGYSIYSMAPSVTFGDAGELAAAAATLSLPHAPSYPLYCLLGNLFGSSLALGNWAYRTNLLSSACSAACLSFLAAGLRLLGLSAPARWSALLFLALNPVWSFHSGMTEVFSLHLLILAGLFWCAARYSRNLWQPRPAAFLGLLTGLGISNHHTVILALPALFWEASAVKPEKPRRSTVIFLLFLAIGLACYLYLPLRSIAEPPLDWGHPTSWRSFLRVFLRKDYGSFSLTVQGQGDSWLGRWGQILRYGEFTLDSLSLTGAALAVLGLAAWPSSGRAMTWRLPALWLILTGPFFLVIGNPPSDPMTSGALDRFYLASWLAAAFLIAGGVQVLHSWNKSAAWALCFIPLWQAHASSPRWLSREDFASYDYGRNLHKSLPRGASLYMDGGDDTFYSLAFLRYAENRRSDLDLRDRGGLVFKNPYGRDFRSLSPAQKEERRVLREHAVASTGLLHYTSLSDRLLPGWRLAPVGVARRAKLDGEKTSPTEPWDFYSLRFNEGLNEGHYRHRALMAFYPYMRAEAHRYSGDYASALIFLRWTMDLGSDALWVRPAAGYAATLMGYESVRAGNNDLALALYLFAARIDGTHADPQLGLGLVYERKGRWEDAEKAYRRAAQLNASSGQAYYNLGALLWKQQRWKETAEALGRAVEISPDNQEWRARLGQARSRAGRE